ncbi:alpha-tocopherol transfer protein [Thrips palmi]|uniref:Alpha-tocopherol transfer protein n=1 Tax=Thrips palmi TaxID=161013 RepID=A0A6P8Y461_THRPL|nr:alpha-tocopherol transfer protein [Thrips palmi]
MPAAASPELPRTEALRPALPDVLDDKVGLRLDEPDEKLKDYARKVLGETEEAKTRTLQELKDTIYERGEVTPYRMDDSFLLRFLRARSFNVERSHRLLKRYMRFKEQNPSYQKNVDPEGFSLIGESDVMTVLPYLDQHGRRILLYRIGNWDPSKVPIDDLFRATLIVLELGIMEPNAQIKGGVVIFDLQGIGLQHAWQVSPTIAAKVIQLLETSSPMQTQAIHILNESWVFDIIYGLFSPILADSALDKLYFHGSDLSSLHEHIDPDHLPKRYGGTRHEVSYTAWLEALRNKNVFRRELKNLGYKIDVDESLDEY